MLVVVPAPSLPPRPAASPPASTVFLPKEHGSWSLALEPLALGLLVAPTIAGAALTTAALAGFFARRPLKAAFAREMNAVLSPAILPGDSTRVLHRHVAAELAGRRPNFIGKTPPQAAGNVSAFTGRRRPARETAVMFSALAAAGFGETLVFGGVTALWPLLLAAPLGGMFAWFDRQNDSRAAAAELAGSAAFALLPATIATLAGWTRPAALALSALALARSVPTVLTVRTALRLGKGQPVNPTVPLAAGVLALGLTGVLAGRHQVPLFAVGLVALLLLRSVFFVTALRPAWPARRIGLIEAGLGALYVGTVALAYHLTPGPF